MPSSTHRPLNLTQNLEIPNKHCVYTLFFANFVLPPCDPSHKPNGKCSEELVQMNFAILGGFFRVDLPLVNYCASLSLTPLQNFALLIGNRGTMAEKCIFGPVFPFFGQFFPFPRRGQIHFSASFPHPEYQTVRIANILAKDVFRARRGGHDSGGTCRKFAAFRSIPSQGRGAPRNPKAPPLPQPPLRGKPWH